MLCLNECPLTPRVYISVTWTGGLFPLPLLENALMSQWRLFSCTGPLSSPLSHSHQTYRYHFYNLLVCFSSNSSLYWLSSLWISFPFLFWLQFCGLFEQVRYLYFSLKYKLVNFRSYVTTWREGTLYFFKHFVLQEQQVL